MAYTGGKHPFDKANALVGPARVLWALPDQDLPVSPWEIIPPVADAEGEYPALTGWNDLGLSADVPEYTHDKDTDGLEYQQTAATLFEQISEITRSFTAEIAEISVDTLKIMENSSTVETVAAAINKSAFKKVHTGLYTELKRYRIAIFSYRPSGAAEVTEPAPSPVGSRPPLVGRIIPLVALAAEGTDVGFDRSDPVNMPVQFTAFPDSEAGVNKEHGYWVVEDPGVILAA